MSSSYYYDYLDYVSVIEVQQIDLNSLALFVWCQLPVRKFESKPSRTTGTGYTIVVCVCPLYLHNDLLGCVRNFPSNIRTNDDVTEQCCCILYFFTRTCHQTIRLREAESLQIFDSTRKSAPSLPENQEEIVDLFDIDKTIFLFGYLLPNGQKLVLHDAQ